MKKTLVSLILVLGTTTTSLATQPIEVVQNLIDSKKSTIHYNLRAAGLSAIRKMKTKDYDITMEGYRYNLSSGGKEITGLVFELKDLETRVSVVDRNADGLGERDEVFLKHNFNGRDSLFLTLHYKGKDDYEIDARIDHHGLQTQEAYFDTTKANPFIAAIIRNKTRPVLEFGEQLYSELVNSVGDGEEPDLPYYDVKKALKKVGEILPKIRGEEDGATKALLKLSKEYLNIIKGKLKRKENLEFEQER